jgi:hypothetical protein
LVNVNHTDTGLSDYGHASEGPMVNRRHPAMVAARLTNTEKALVDAAAEARGQTVQALIRELVLPVVGRELAEHAAALSGPAAGGDRAA